MKIIFTSRRKLSVYQRVQRGNTIDAIVTYMWYTMVEDAKKLYVESFWAEVKSASDWKEKAEAANRYDEKVREDIAATALKMGKAFVIQLNKLSNE